MKVKQTFFSQSSILVTGMLVFLSSCGNNQQQAEIPPAEVPVEQVKEGLGLSRREYPASIQGVSDVEIRPQVSGYLHKILVDEGAYVQAGQSLFKIDDRVYMEQYNTAKAAILVAKANQKTAKIDLDRKMEMVREGIVSDLQLHQAQASYDAAAAALAQAEAAAQSAKINYDFCTIKAPVSGYLGRIPYRLGSLIGMSSVEPLTVVSDARQINVYFNMSEIDFIQFQEKHAGSSVQEKLKHAAPVDLMVANGSVYPHKGRIDAVEGRFNETTGSVTFRAKFDNQQGALRAGNTGKIVIEQQYDKVLLIPIASTMSIQDKIYVFGVEKDNKVVQKGISVLGKSGTNYMVSSGISAGDRYITAGFERLQPGMTVLPQQTKVDQVNAQLQGR
ncbi:efflux RND transporter periplasmic adaptor subunit [Sphingobacterium tabacisoli]